jgi:hypothetical protein
VLRAATATEPGTVSGTLLLPSGEPLANRKLRVLPITARSYDPSQPATVPGPIEVTTGPDGSFTVNLGTGQEVGFNLEVYGPDGTTLVEFVDVEKPSGPFSVTLTTGGDVKNRLGVSDEPPPEPVKGRPPIGASRHGKTRPFTARITTSDLNIFRTDARLENGLIVPESGSSSTKCREWGGLLTNSGVIAGNESLNRYFFRYERGMVGAARYGKVCLTDLSYNDPFYDYQIEISTDSPATWRFFDVLAASYALRVYRAGDHWLNYNSKEPEINTIEISTGLV